MQTYMKKSKRNNLSGISELYILAQNVGHVTGKRHDTIKAHTQQVQLTFDLLDLESLTETGYATRGWYE